VSVQVMVPSKSKSARSIADQSIVLHPGRQLHGMM